ncbi:hypothetical protein [Parendozoicomonas sp. Alg238-R29]|uniref:hypothetical protein n=1 Tax=Parendozoicomonas sp. Alg238-R29 TaxID=2993446 RepID=UPI00248E8F7F|nr:hypothetical protein [Parendozoicomonas sp. Alg238-R29]
MNSRDLMGKIRKAFGKFLPLGLRGSARSPNSQSKAKISDVNGRTIEPNDTIERRFYERSFFAGVVKKFGLESRNSESTAPQSLLVQGEKKYLGQVDGGIQVSKSRNGFLVFSSTPDSVFPDGKLGGSYYLQG